MAGPGSRRKVARAAVRACVATVGASGLLLGLVVPVEAQEGPPAPGPDEASLAAIMSGEGGGVAATATSGVAEDDDSFTVRLTVRNAKDHDVRVEVPFGSMFVPADESQQTVVTAGPRDPALASTSSGGGPVFVAPPGTSMFELVGFCGQEFDDSPGWDVPVTYGGVAAAPLPRVLANVAASPTVPPEVAQDAVWWVTDRPELPIADPRVEKLLDGVDTAAFAKDPIDVVPGGQGQSASAVLGSGLTPVLGSGLALVVLLFVGGLVALSLSGRRRVALAAARRLPPNSSATSPAPGWYRDPWSPCWRYWDGWRWTGAHR